MSRTINGKTIKEIMEALASDVPAEYIQTREYDNKPYISIENYTERLNDVLGVDHYNMLYTEPVITIVKDTYTITTLGTIEVLDDNFEIILKKSCAGASTVMFPKVDKVDETGKTVKVEGENPTAIANNVLAAYQDAFKRICKNSFQIGAKQLSDATGLPTGKEFTVTSKYSKPLGEKYTFTTVTVEGSNVDRLAIFSNKADVFKKLYPNGLKANEPMKIIAKEGKDKQGNDQLIFEGFAPGFVPGKPAASAQTTAPTSDSQTTQAASVQTPSVPTAETNKSQSVPSEDVCVEMTTVSNLVDCGKGMMSMDVSLETGEKGKLFFNSEGQNFLTTEGYFDSFIQMGEAGIGLRLNAEKKGNNYLFKSLAV